MDYLRITILLFSLACGQETSPNLIPPNPIYYVNDSIKIACDSVISSVILSIDIIINNSDINYDIVCRKENGKWVAPKITGMISDDNCVNLPTPGRATMNITTRIAERMRSSTVTCKVNYYEGDVKTGYAIKANAFSDAYAEPTRLEFDKFEFDDELPVLNKRIRASCLSFGGYPTSDFIYEVRSKSDTIVHRITELRDGAAEFTVNDQLKNGFKVTCRDKVHTRGEISLTKQNCSGSGSELCLPYYLTSKVPSSNIVSLNPSYSNPVKCDVEGYPSDKIMYTWTSDGEVLPAVTAATYTIPSDIKKAGKTEILSCTAFLDKYGRVNITWKITWSLQATTTTAPPTTAIGIGVGAGLLGLIVAVVVGIVLYKKKRGNTRRHQNTASDPASVTDEKKLPTLKSSQQPTDEI